ncbi:MAG: PD40 domain-containing protein, partial [Anaerolineae bacterium]|nr:PD40 domain-containing protein [Anaerolineae bacterium]
VPEAWLRYDDPLHNAVLFAPQADDVCADPGMRVTLVGRVANGTTPDQLLDQYLRITGAQDTPTARIAAGSFGRATFFDLACGDLMRSMRVSAFVQYGTAYRIEQWTPQDEFAAWNELFAQMISQFAPSDSVIVPEPTPSPVPTQTQGDQQDQTGDQTPDQTQNPVDDAATPASDHIGESTSEATPEATDAGTPVAAADVPLELAALPFAHMFVGDVFLGELNRLPGRSVTSIPTDDRRYLTFSPDGLFISYINMDTAQLRALNVVEGLSPRKLADNVDPAFPPAWSPDSSQIAYVVDTGETSASGEAIKRIDAVPAAGGAVQTLGTFAFAATCEAAAAVDDAVDPADAPYAQEIAGQERALAWLPGNRMLFSPRCDGGLSILSVEDQQLVELGADLWGGALAPDGLHFLTHAADGLVLLNFTAWERQNLRIAPAAQQVAWSPDGASVYYSVETLVDSRTLDDPTIQQRGTAIFGAWPVAINVYRIELYRLDLATQTETLLWQSQGRGIGRIAPAPDGSGVLFSQIPSGVLLAEVFQAGGDLLAVHEAMPTPALYWLPTGGTLAHLLAYSGQPAFAPFTVSAKEPVTGP